MCWALCVCAGYTSFSERYSHDWGMSRRASGYDGSCCLFPLNQTLFNTSHVLTQGRYLTSVVKCTTGPSFQSHQTKQVDILKLLEQCLTKSTTYDCAKIRKPKLDSGQSCEITHLIFLILPTGKLQHEERSEWQSPGANLNSSEPGPAVLPPTPHLPAQTRDPFHRNGFLDNS